MNMVLLACDIKLWIVVAYCVARSSAAKVSTMQDKRTLVLQEEGFSTTLKTEFS